MSSMLPRPGDLTVPFKGGPIGMYSNFPDDNVIAFQTPSFLDEKDGMLCVIAHVREWLFVLSTSGKLGWIYEYDVGPSTIAGAVYHIPR